MGHNMQDDLKDINRAILTPLVHNALQNNTIEIIDWSSSDLSTGLVNVYRFTGTGRDKGQVVPWSIILKVVRSWGYGDTNLSHPTYWKREVLAYQSGLLNNLKGGLLVPRCYDVMEYADDKIGLWLEEVNDDCENPWSSACYEIAAYKLGRFNGAYTSEADIPAFAWLSHDFIQRTSKLDAPTLEQPENGHHSPIPISQLADTNSQLAHFWQKRAALLAMLADLPKTFCHRDAARRNLYLRQNVKGTSNLGAFDWTIAGLGVLGEEIATLIVTSCLLSEVDSADVVDLEHLILNRYVDGLKDAGWDGNLGQVEQGYILVSLFRFCPIIARQLNSTLSTGISERWEQLRLLLSFLLDRGNTILGGLSPLS